MTLIPPEQVVTAPVRKAGGDDKVPRDKLKRPRIWVECSRCNDPFGSDYLPEEKDRGKVASPKTGKPIQCPSCKGEGRKLQSYTRTTTYIDVIDDKSNLEQWNMRMVLVGVDKDRKLLNDAEGILLRQKLAEEEGDKEEAKEHKDELNRRAQVAKKLAGAEEKADKGTELHELSELEDTDQDLPARISFEDSLDLYAYRRVSVGFDIRHMEELVVCDQLKVGGTPDRVSTWTGEGVDPSLCDQYPDTFVYDEESDRVVLVAPDGYELSDPNELFITDLKTGTVDYGALKMAMQLATYAHSELYDPETGERTPLGNINQKWGVIMNVPAGSGEASLLWADLELGWEALQIATEVRRLRNVGRKALFRFHSV